MLSFIKRNPAPVALLVGLVMAAQSILWEYVRMKPDYRFIVEPWSIRGHALTQGRVITVMALGLLVLAYLAWRRLDRTLPTIGIWVAIGVVAGGAALAAITDPETSDVSLNALAGIWVAAALAAIVAIAYRNLLAPRLGGIAGHATWPLWLIVLLVGYLAVIKPIIVDDSVNLELWLIVLLTLGPAAGLMVLLRPFELAVNRILIVSVAGAWLVQTVSAGAVRSTLIRHQIEMGAAAQYKDTQITSGMMLAFFGFLLALAGAIGLWAQRRDQIIAIKRARQQREAAQASMAELHEAPA